MAAAASQPATMQTRRPCASAAAPTSRFPNALASPNVIRKLSARRSEAVSNLPPAEVMSTCENLDTPTVHPVAKTSAPTSASCAREPRSHTIHADVEEIANAAPPFAGWWRVRGGQRILQGQDSK